MKEFAGFILVGDQEVLIQSRKKRWSTSWPWVGYVDLRDPVPVIQYRGSLPMHLMPLVFIWTVVVIPFFAFLLYINYRQETSAIAGIIRRHMPE